MTADLTAVQLRSYGLGCAGIGRSFWEGHITERHEKVPVRCLCIMVLHGRTVAITAASTATMVVVIVPRPLLLALLILLIQLFHNIKKNYHTILV